MNSNGDALGAASASPITTEKATSKRTRVLIAGGIAVVVAVAATFGGIAVANNIALANAQNAYKSSEAALTSQLDKSSKDRAEFAATVADDTTYKVSVDAMVAATGTAVDAAALQAVVDSSAALGELLKLQAEPALIRTSADSSLVATDELNAAAEADNALVAQREVSVAKTAATAKTIAAGVDTLEAAVAKVAASVETTSKTVFDAAPKAAQDKKDAFTAAVKDAATAVKGKDAAEVVKALTAYGVAAKALVDAHNAQVAAEAAAAAAQAAADAAARGDSTYVDPTTGAVVSTPGSGGGSSSGGGSTGGGGGSTGGGGCSGNQENACVKTPPTFSTNGLYTPGCDGFDYGSHNVGYGGNSQNGLSIGAPWSAYVSGPTVYFVVCL